MLKEAGTVDINSDLLWFISEWIFTFTRELEFQNIRQVRKVIQDGVDEFNTKQHKPHVDEILESLKEQGMVDSQTVKDVKHFWLNDKGYMIFQDKYRDFTVDDVKNLDEMT
jgi:hypothetical protein